MACQPVAADNSPIQSPLASLAPSVIAFAIGVFFSSRLAAVFAPTILWIALATAALAVLYSLRIDRKPLAFTLFIPLFFILGVIRATPFAEPPTSPDHIYNQIQTRSEVAVAGILTEMPSIPTDRCRFKIAAEQLIFPDGTITPTHGLVLLTIAGRLPNDIEPGDRLLARAVLKRPRNFSTPGTFNYRKYLADQNIRITGWVRSPALVHKFSQPVPPTLFQQLRYLPERLRHRLGVFLQQNFDQQTSSLYRALLLGDRSAVSPLIIENFTAAGCIHLLAISGTHMGIIALLVTVLAAWLLKRSTRLMLHLPIWKTAALIALPPLFTYAMLAGFQTPAVRALVMTTVFLLAILIDRQWSVPINIAIAAFLLLVWKPGLIHTASFQLSFTAVLAITLLYPQISNLLMPRAEDKDSTVHKLRRWLPATLAVSTAATVGVIPLLLLHFNRLSTLSPISTLLVEPFLCLWSLTSGLFACLLLPISPWLATKLFHLGSLGLHGALFLSSSLAALPFASLRLPTPTPIQISLYYLALLAFSQHHRYQRSRPVAAMALLALTGTFFWNFALAAQDTNLRVEILDVGQGSATVVELPRHRAILIDGGSYLGDHFDVGERIIAPFLWKRGITKLEAVVVSHPHADHYNGLPFILRNFQPKTLWTNGSPAGAPDYQALLQEARALAIEVKTPGPKIPLYADKRMQLYQIAPSSSETGTTAMSAASPGTTTNRRSLILRLVYRQRSFLFPGDIDATVERRMARGGEEFDSDVLLAPHHGSKGSMSDTLIKAVTPAYIVVSAGTSRPGGMATENDVRKWQGAGATVFDTANDGAVTFITDGVQLSATTTKQPPP